MNSRVSFSIPDFMHEGIAYTDIEVIVEFDDVRDDATVAETLRRPLEAYHG
ncbi:MAG: hypothetical protein JO119_09765 [Acidobacteria bacterium]|nr:hypothetical protein [Acidobacteriota bacterium]